MPGPTPRRLGAKELRSLFRHIGSLRGWKDVEREAVECVKKVQMAGFATVAAVAAGAADGTLNAALKAAGRKQFGAEALEILAEATAGEDVASHAYAPEPQQTAQEKNDQLIGAEPEGCPICLAPLPPVLSSLRVRTPCNHEFCMNCLHRLLRTAYKHRCPMCRAKLPQEFVDSLHEAEDEEDRRAWLRDVREYMRQSGSSQQDASGAGSATVPGSSASSTELVQLRVGNSHDAVGVMRSAENDSVSTEDASAQTRRHRWTLYVRSAAADSTFPVSDYLDRVAMEYKPESGGDSSVHDEQSAAVVRTVLRGPEFEWVCETRRPVLVSIKLFWQQWTGLGRHPTSLTHLVCLSGVPWDENDNGHLMGAGVRLRNSNAPGEQMEQMMAVRLSPVPGALEEHGVTPGEQRRRQDAARRTTRARFASLATPSRHGVAATNATMAARREARARSSAALSGDSTLTTTASGGSSEVGLPIPPNPPAAAFGRRAASLHASGASTERWHRRTVMTDQDGAGRHQQLPRHASSSARAGRRAAVAPVGGSPRLMAGVEAAAALRALAGDQLLQIAGTSGDIAIRSGEVASGGGIDAAEARLIEIRERYALRRAVLSLQATRARRHRERGLGNASARLLLR